MSTTRALISVEQYLRTSYRPDCDYVDGDVVERNLGEWDHGWLQGLLTAYLLRRYRREGIFGVPEVKPPYLCIEILSPEDRMQRVQNRIDDYIEMGVPLVWVLNSQTKRVYAATEVDGLREVKILRTDNPVIEVPLDEIFA